MNRVPLHTLDECINLLEIMDYALHGKHYSQSVKKYLITKLDLEVDSRPFTDRQLIQESIEYVIKVS